MSIPCFIPPLPDGTRELVLPSGRFARIRPITTADRLVCGNREKAALILAMACQIVTLDDEPMNVEDLLFMPASETTPFLEVVALRLLEARMV